MKRMTIEWLLLPPTLLPSLHQMKLTDSRLVLQECGVGNRCFCPRNTTYHTWGTSNASFNALLLALFAPIGSSHVSHHLAYTLHLRIIAMGHDTKHAWMPVSKRSSCLSLPILIRKDASHVSYVLSKTLLCIVYFFNNRIGGHLEDAEDGLFVASDGVGCSSFTLQLSLIFSSSSLSSSFSPHSLSLPNKPLRLM